MIDCYNRFNLYPVFCLDVQYKLIVSSFPTIRTFLAAPRAKNCVDVSHCETH